MKKLFLLSVFVFFINLSFSQLLIEENFDYPENTLLTETGNWIQQGSTSTNPLTVQNGNLVLIPYSHDPIGKYLFINNTGQDAYRTFTSQVGNTVYASFLINVSTAQTSGDYFFTFQPSPGNTNYTGRFFVKKDVNNKLAFGISKGTDAPVYTNYVYNFNTIYLIVIKYQMIEGTQNDVISVFINPPVGQQEPTTPTISTTGGTTGDPNALAAILLRQGSSTSAPTLYIDAIRVGLSWEETVNKETIPPIFTFNPPNGAINVDLNVNISITSNKPIRNLDNTEITNLNVSNLIIFKVSNENGQNVAFSASINNEKKIITVFPSNPLTPNTTYYLKLLQVEDYYNNASSEQIIYFTTRSLSSEANIISFNIIGQVTSSIDNVLQKVNVIMPNGTDLTNLTPQIEVSPGATIHPPSGVPQNFTYPFVYLVTAEDGVTTKEWTVYVTYQYSTQAEILSFEIPGQVSSVINSELATINVLMPYGTDLTNLTPNITVSPGATINPPSGVAQNFTNPVIYTVTAEDGITTKQWTAIVTNEQQSAITLVEWTFPNNPDDNIADGGIQPNLNRKITCSASGTVTYNAAGATTSSARATGWHNGQNQKFWQVEFTTSGYKNIRVSSKQRSSSTGPRDFKLQYMVNNSGHFADVPNSNITCADNFTSGVLNNLQLPDECNFKEIITLRWIMSSNIAVNGSAVISTGASNIDDIIITGIPSLSNEAEILDFVIPGYISKSINSANASVYIIMPYGTDITNLTPQITISPGATITPQSGVPQNFSTPVTYVVTAEDGITTKVWTVYVVVGPNNQAEIIDFYIPGQISSSIYPSLALIKVVMPYGTDLTNLTPQITISPGATITPPSGVPQDFSDTVMYIVTAENGSTIKNWYVYVRNQSNKAEILNFFIPGQISSTINSQNATVTVIMPYGTDLTNLVPSITISEGATINPPDMTPTDFTNPVNYTVIAENGNIKIWTVYVNTLLNNQAEILSFTIENQISSIINSQTQTINVKMPYGTDLTNLIPHITVSPGATIYPNSGVPTNFTTPVVYTVTAQDGVTQKQWTAIVTNEEPPIQVIVEWTFPNNPDDSLADGGISANLDKIITCTASGPVSYAYSGATTNCARATGWHDGANVKYWKVSFTTIGFKDIKVSSKQRSSSTGPRNFKLQYMINNTNQWYDVPNTNITCADNFTQGVLNEVLLPADCNQKNLISLRWIMTSNISVGGNNVASNGSSRIDDIIVIGTPALNNEANIISFNIPNQISSTINHNDTSVTVLMPYGTDVTNLTPEIIVSPGATINPPSGVAQNFTNPVIYTVISEDNTSIKYWKVYVIVGLNNQADILSFEIPGQISSNINYADTSVTVLMPHGTNLTNLTPIITISQGAIITPPSGTPQDFTNPVIYTVTAQDGITTKYWKVTVTTAPPQIDVIVEWTFPNNPDDSLADGGIPANLDKIITCTASGSVSYAYPGASTNCARATGWNDGANTKYWRVDFTTLGYKDIKVSSKQRSSSTGPRDFKLQYMVDNNGLWFDVDNSTIVCADNFTSGVLNELPLPETCNHKQLVSLRWIMTSNTSVSGNVVSSTGSSRIDDIIVIGIYDDLYSTQLTQENVSIYPNPANTYLIVKCNDIKQINILDISGKIVLSAKENILNIDHLNNGIYFVKVETNITTVFLKFVKN
ncbi:MAG: DUF5018 domain-containing protein [Bacteroidales bacterium]|nr:DUF5018 domain-containing protein [Bacteroidales bacterium]